MNNFTFCPCSATQSLYGSITYTNMLRELHKIHIHKLPQQCVHKKWSGRVASCIIGNEREDKYERHLLWTRSAQLYKDPKLDPLNSCAIYRAPYADTSRCVSSFKEGILENRYVDGSRLRQSSPFKKPIVLELEIVT